jgi:hypothetical protein
VTNTILTIKTHYGFTALAKEDRFGVHVKTFANRTQAEKAARQFGGQVVQPNRAFLVMIEA